MAESAQPVLNLEFDASNEVIYQAPITSQNVSFHADPAVSGPNNVSNIVWQVDIPSNTLLGSKVFMKFPIQCEFKSRFTYTKSDDSVANPGLTSGGGSTHLCFAKNCFIHLIDTLEIDINSTKLTNQPSRWINAITDYLPVSDDKNNELSFWPNQPDIAPTFRELLSSSNRDYSSSPFSASSLTNKWGKRSLAFYEVSESAPDGSGYRTTTIKADIILPLLNKPFYGAGASKPLANVDRLIIRANLNKDYHKLLTRMEAINYLYAEITSSSMIWRDSLTPTLLYQTIEVPEVLNKQLYAKGGVPISQEYEYSEMQIFSSKESNSLAYGASHANLQTSSNILSTTPTYLLIYAEKSAHDYSNGGNTVNSAANWVMTPDSYGLITSLTVNVNNRLHVFNDVSQLYSMSASEGLSLPYATAMCSGFPIMINTAKFLSLGDLTPGSWNKSNLTITATVKNPASVPLSTESDAKNPTTSTPTSQFTLVCVYPKPGVLTIGDKKSKLSFIELNDEDRKRLNQAAASFETKNNGVVVGGSMQPFNVGGNFLSNLWSGIKSVAKVVAPVADTVGSVSRAISGGKNNNSYLKGGSLLTGGSSETQFTRIT